MSFFGRDTRKIEGVVFVKEAEFESQDEARHWAEYYSSSGYASRVIPNASRQTFEIWVSAMPSGAAPAPTVAA